MEDRLKAISKPLPHTFEWLWDETRHRRQDRQDDKSQDFMEWLEDSELLFWIQGNPGSGKSSKWFPYPELLGS